MQTMTEQQTHDFLSAGTRTAELATVREDGRPHVAPIWFVLDDDGTLVFTTGAGTMKGRAIQRHPAVCLCIDDEAPPFAFVMIDGTAGSRRRIRTTCSTGRPGSAPVTWPRPGRGLRAKERRAQGDLLRPGHAHKDRGQGPHRRLTHGPRVRSRPSRDRGREAELPTAKRSSHEARWSSP